MSDAKGSELRTVLHDFVNDVRAMQSELQTRLDKQEKQMSTIQAKAARVRPTLAAEPFEAPHRKAFDAYVRSGDDGPLRGVEVEGKSVTTVADNGGFLVDPQTSKTVQDVLLSTSSLRRVANVVQVEATSYDVLVDREGIDTEWVGETSARTQAGAQTVERISIPLHELSALPKASQRLLDDAAFDVEEWLARRIAESFAKAEADAFIKGDGNDKPLGLLMHAKGNAGANEIGYVTTGTLGGFGGSDALVDLVYALGAEYRANGTFVMNSQTAGRVRKLKDGDGRFMWSDGIAAGEPARLLGYPVLIAEKMDDVANNSYSIAFGDFRAGYTIAERPDLRILRDPFSQKPHVLFYATKRVGGGVTDFSAIKLLKFGTS
jgi:HK97 family phage major capsid protein